MAGAKTSWLSNPTALGAVLTLLAGASLFAAPMQDRNAFVMSPGLEGCLAVGSVGLLLALLGGLNYAQVVRLSLPIFAIQALSCWYAREPWLGVLGLQFLGLGLVGVLRPAQKAQEQRTEQKILESSAQGRGSPNADRVRTVLG